MANPVKFEPQPVKSWEIGVPTNSEILRIQVIATNWIKEINEGYLRFFEGDKEIACFKQWSYIIPLEKEEAVRNFIEDLEIDVELPKNWGKINIEGELI
jgi:hypothetical protein